MPRSKIKKAKILITYHGRTGKLIIHQTASGRKYIMVRAKGGKGVKRLYEGSMYRVNRKGGEIKKLVLR